MPKTCFTHNSSSDEVLFESESGMKAISKFEPKSSASIKEQIKSHFDDPDTDLCPDDDSDVCPGLHSTYYINIPNNGGPNNLPCPTYSPGVNCRGLKLNHLQALHVAVQYSYRDLK